MEKNKVIVILGTTASGKTDLALALAKKFYGEIISADSRQVYRGMNIGTGKDLDKYVVKKTRNQKNKKIKSTIVPYHLIDVVSPRKQFTVADYQKLAYGAIKDILHRGKLPIICGGTGLYIDAVVKGYALDELKITNYELQKVRQRLEKLSLDKLLQQLKRIDLKTYKIIDKKNRRRVQRALEIYYERGIPKSKQQPINPPLYEFLKIGIAFPKDALKKRISQRLEKRLKRGMVLEIKKLHTQGVSWKKLESFGLEYRWVSRYVRRIITREEMKENLLKDIIYFAKRQMTWFKRDTTIHWTQKRKDIENFIKIFLKTE